MNAAERNISVGENTKVTLHFALKLVNGEIVDSTFDKQPATFAFGDGNLLLGFENKLIGMRKGERRQFTVAPEEAFGQPNPANVQRFKRSDFDSAMELYEGLVISFADASQAELPGVVAKFDGDEVTVDFNHPLAGRVIYFDVEILDVAAV
jgi:FKBP-type peptidyl-prolyl cis-trans isomerase SlpA